MAVYAVRQGHQIGKFNTWEDCQQATKGYSGAEFKKFSTIEEADRYLAGEDILDTISYPEVAKDDEIILYVDGSYDKNKVLYGAGVVAITSKGTVELKGCDDEVHFCGMQSIAGELLATAIGVTYAVQKGYKNITLCYDNIGIKEWTKHGTYRRNKEGTIAYRNFMDTMEEDFDLKFTFVHVKGHSKIKYNELADRLAKSSIVQNKRVDTTKYLEIGGVYA